MNSFQKKPLELTLIAVSLLFVLTILFTLGWNLKHQSDSYQRVFRVIFSGDQPDIGSLIATTRSQDFAFNKTTALLLAFGLIFTGVLYILNNQKAKFDAGFESDSMKATFSSNSPGLVLTTLGVILTIFVLYSKTSITTYNVTSQDSPMTSSGDLVSPDLDQPFTSGEYP